MAEFPAMPLWTDAYLADTRHLTTAQHGAYLLLLIVHWRIGVKGLPNDEKLLARYAGLPLDKWRKIAPTILEFFESRETSLVQARLLDELQHLQSQKLRGAAGGRAKALKIKQRHSSKPPSKALANGYQTPSPTTTTTTIIEQPNGCLSEMPSDEPDKVDPMDVVKAWNALAGKHGLAKVQKLSAKRKQQLKARIRENSFDDFAAALAAIGRSPFLLGQSKGGWRADFDFFLQPSSFVKLLEGSYDH